MQTVLANTSKADCAFSGRRQNVLVIAPRTVGTRSRAACHIVCKVSRLLSHCITKQAVARGTYVAYDRRKTFGRQLLRQNRATLAYAQAASAPANGIATKPADAPKLELSELTAVSPLDG